MVKQRSPLARGLRVSIAGTRIPLYEIAGFSTTWGRQELNEPPRSRTATLKLYYPDSADDLRAAVEFMRKKIVVDLNIPTPTTQTKEPKTVPVFRGYVDEVEITPNHPPEDGGRVLIRAIEATDYEDIFRLTPDVFPRDRKAHNAKTMINEWLIKKGRPRLGISAYTVSGNPELYPASHKQEKRTIRQWLEASICRPMGSYPCWSPDYQTLRVSTCAARGLTWGGLTELPATNVISTAAARVGPQHRTKLIWVENSGAVIGPKRHIIIDIDRADRHGPVMKIISDYGVYTTDYKEDMTALWKLQVTGSRKFTFSDRLIAPSWWENRYCWLPWEDLHTGISIAGDPIATIMGAPPCFTVIGGTLTVTTTETTHTVNAIWRTPPT
ncbi:hypothetical protein [Corynebacterium freiburgense]|uniref:hypothetical protein n=2 Tax=Corynebacterium freiburgense TaxID=556548 RepID=UPI000421705C|nr:hypothetical protein [Corynebacterium freiburgense]WJZ03479.1 hypothetical protein CFREI_11050 [Corynebacterium freiburgense]WJZ03569.1 hypothetical protein CFREI_11550 [Corynebacterium freiburgense]WJZ03986.1 hypothetical protein CFREI_13700 [Corynebacterium freiburgense]